MKKLVLLLMATGLLSFSSVEINPIKNTSVEKNKIECKYSQCQATAKSTGKQCKHCVSNEGDLYCWQHEKK